LSVCWKRSTLPLVCAAARADEEVLDRVFAEQLA
jgi:hypothetical protein